MERRPHPWNDGFTWVDRADVRRPPTTLTPEQVRERYAKGQCFVCGESSHVKANCPTKQKN